MYELYYYSLFTKWIYYVIMATRWQIMATKEYLLISSAADNDMYIMSRYLIMKTIVPNIQWL